MAHDHAGHHHHHAHHDDSSGARAPDRRFALAIALNLGYVAMEVAVGVVAGSAALLADAAHNLSDVLGLGAAWIAVVLARRPADLRFTWGFRNATILSALFNGAMLMLVAGALGWEALGRIAAPVPVQGGLVVVAAIAGAVVNAGTALLFLRGRNADVNLRGAYLHMMADAAVSLGVALSGAAVLATGHAWIDPVVALVVVAVIIGSTWDLLRESIELSLAASPRRVRVEEVAAFLASRPGGGRCPRSPCLAARIDRSGALGPSCHAGGPSRRRRAARTHAGSRGPLRRRARGVPDRTRPSRRLSPCVRVPELRAERSPHLSQSLACCFGRRVTRSLRENGRSRSRKRA
ncbi:cation diffusion facilitator family transporter [Rubrimonas sp.]|uniref:cation diffusion facilitator family transporter n=1 Tax=Rubrimonas sp. TaxID=2036015 RepID=UPI002FDECCE2